MDTNTGLSCESLGSAHFLLHCLPPAPTMNGTSYGQALCPFRGSQPPPLSSSHRHLHPLSRRLPSAFRHLQKPHLSTADIPSNFLLPLASKLLETFQPVCTFSPHPPLKPPNHTLTKRKVMVPLQACFFLTLSRKAMQWRLPSL